MSLIKLKQQSTFCLCWLFTKKRHWNLCSINIKAVELCTRCFFLYRLLTCLARRHSPTSSIQSIFSVHFPYGWEDPHTKSPVKERALPSSGYATDVSHQLFILRTRTIDIRRCLRCDNAKLLPISAAAVTTPTTKDGFSQLIRLVFVLFSFTVEFSFVRQKIVIRLYQSVRCSCGLHTVNILRLSQTKQIAFCIVSIHLEPRELLFPIDSCVLFPSHSKWISGRNWFFLWIYSIYRTI